MGPIRAGTTRHSKEPVNKAIETTTTNQSEVDDFKESSENHVEDCDVLKVKTEPDDFEALPLQTRHVQF